MQNIDVISHNITCWMIDSGWEFAKAGAILIIGTWLIKKVCKIFAVVLSQMHLEVGLISFFSSAFKLFLRIILGLLFLSALGVNITSIMTALGASIVTAGILIKDSISNFISGLLIIFNKPIRVGDYIEFENTKGRVMKIEPAFTTLRSPEGTSVIIPNFRLLSNNILRESPYNICENSFFVQISNLKTRLDAKKVLDGILLANKTVLEIPAPKVEYLSIDESGIKLKVSIFCEKKFIPNLKKDLGKSVHLTFKKLNAHAMIDDWKDDI